MNTVPEPTFQLSMLGRFELAGPDGSIDPTSKKLAALLAYLACTAPQAHSRDKLMTLLWGSHFDAQARQNLRQALTRLRRVLGDNALLSTAESISQTNRRGSLWISFSVGAAWKALITRYIVTIVRGPNG